jgi:hypothetical protein
VEICCISTRPLIRPRPPISGTSSNRSSRGACHLLSCGPRRRTGHAAVTSHADGAASHSRRPRHGLDGAGPLAVSEREHELVRRLGRSAAPDLQVDAPLRHVWTDALAEPWIHHHEIGARAGGRRLFVDVTIRIDPSRVVFRPNVIDTSVIGTSAPGAPRRTVALRDGCCASEMPGAPIEIAKVSTVNVRSGVDGMAPPRVVLCSLARRAH